MASRTVLEKNSDRNSTEIAKHWLPLTCWLRPPTDPHGLSAWRLAVTTSFHVTLSCWKQGGGLWANALCRIPSCLVFHFYLSVISDILPFPERALTSPYKVVMQTLLKQWPPKALVSGQLCDIRQVNDSPWSSAEKINIIGLIALIWKWIIGNLCKLTN